MLNFIQSVILTIILIPFLTLAGMFGGLMFGVAVAKMCFVSGVTQTTQGLKEVLKEVTKYIKNCTGE